MTPSGSGRRPWSVILTPTMLLPSGIGHVSSFKPASPGVMPDHSAAKTSDGVDDVVSDVEGFLTTLLEQRYENTIAITNDMLTFEPLL